MNIVTKEKPFVFKVVDFRTNIINTWCFDSKDKCKLAFENWFKTELKEFRENGYQSNILGFCYKASYKDLNQISYYFETSITG